MSKYADFKANCRVSKVVRGFFKTHSYWVLHGLVACCRVLRAVRFEQGTMRVYRVVSCSGLNAKGFRGLRIRRRTPTEHDAVVEQKLQQHLAMLTRMALPTRHLEENTFG